ncbi:restriction endonuclease [Asanoa siamensis]|uniref:Restriction endonuclease type IV Mrr domain-containing protein n=1 Tax=Asanoa siamensis TaxID=926357 RepID=A0ABQ4CTQ1_9ACTN|nr:restriction endonuclease [Asanoa siamensis]GIF74643.1 hypothetical protein Asi02nite_41610 [Asanoa siamensis]
MARPPLRLAPPPARRTRDTPLFVIAGTCVGALVAAAQLLRVPTELIVAGLVVVAIVGARLAARRRRMTEGDLAARVATVLRAGGWRRVTVTSTLGHLGTDVVGVARDGRRWLLRCPRDPASLTAADVSRFAEAARYLGRGDVTVLVTSGPVPPPVRAAATQARVTLVDSDDLPAWIA